MQTQVSALGETDEQVWIAWCDGCALPNPGRIGVGGLLRSPRGEYHEFSRPAGHSGCNNEAELLALSGLLELALERGVSRLKVFSDSDLVVRVAPDPANGEARRLGPRFEAVRALMARFERLDLCWLPQHRNQAADELSRRALGLPPRSPARRRT